LFTSVSQVHSHAIRAATRSGCIWQLASTVRGKIFLKHFGPKIWDFIDPSSYMKISHLYSKGILKTDLLMHILSEYRVLGKDVCKGSTTWIYRCLLMCDISLILV